MVMTRDEKNRFIAEALGWKGIIVSAGVSFKEGTLLGLDPSEKHGPYHPLPDFYTSEEANALVLEAMKPVSVHLYKSFTQVRKNEIEDKPNYGPLSQDNDRKAAICEAFIEWKQRS